MRTDKTSQAARIYVHSRIEELRVMESLRAARFKNTQLMHRLVTVQKRRSKAGKFLDLGLYGE